MGLFSLRRAARVDDAELETDVAGEPDDLDDVDNVDDDLDDLDDEEGVDRPRAEPGDGTVGPFDRVHAPDESDYLKLGGLWLKGQQGMELRFELDEQHQQITGVTVVIGETAVQLQAFAAPRTEGVWIDIRNEIAESITSAGGTAEVVAGEFGDELQTRMPQVGPDGRTVFAPARFIGVDGPRWFLRAVVSGRGAIEPEAAADVHDVIRSVVVDRGDEAMPPREMLPITLPEAPPEEVADGGAEVGEGEQGHLDPAAMTDLDDGDNDDDDNDDDGKDDAQSGSAPRRNDNLKPFERGPEITEVR